MELPEQSGSGSSESQPSKSAVSVALPLGGKQAIQFFSLAPFAVAIFDRDLRYIAASKKWIKDYGLVGKRVLGESQYDLFPRMSDEWRDYYRRCLAGESFDDQESTFAKLKGVEWISWKMHPWTDDDGAIGGVILFTEFISDQKRRSLELEKNQQHLETVLESVHDGIMACDVDGKINLVNSATRQMVIEAHKSVPKDLHSPAHQIYRADTLEPLGKDETPLARALKGEVVDGEQVVLAPNTEGEQRIVARSKAMYDASGTMIGAVASMHIITDEWRVSEQLRESEKQYRSLYHETPAMLHTVNREGNLTRVSDFWLRKLGYKRDEIIGKPFFDLLPDESRKYVREQILPEFVRNGYLESVEFALYKKDGSAIDVQMSVIAQRDSEGGYVSSFAVLTDISVRKQFEVELRRSEGQFRFLYHETPAMLHSVNRDGVLVRVSDFWLKSLGYKREEVIGVKFRDFLSPSSGEYARTILLPEFLRTGHLKHAEVELVKKSGEVINGQLTTTAMRDDSGAVTTSLSVLTDITARKQVERRLKRSEKQFHAAFQASPLGMALISPSADWIEVNAAFCEIIGYEIGELFNINIRDITHPDDLKTDSEHLERLLEGAKDSFQLEKRYIHKDGSTIWASVSVILIRDANNEPVHFVTQVLNLTDRKHMERALQRSEEQFRSAFETSPQGMALVSPGGRWLTANTALCEIFGYSKEELLEKGIQNLTHPDDIDTEVDDIKKLLRGEDQSFDMEKRYLHKSGATIWAQVSISLIRDDAGDPAQFVFQMLDLTQRREAEEQLLQAQKLEAVGQLTGGLAHDFNNLLAVILISLQLLERSHGDDPKSLKRIKAALDATERGAELTHRLLAFSRKQSLEQKVIDVKRLVKGMTGLLSRTLSGVVNLQTHFAKELWKIESDQSQLETGILNLAINARDAMPSGGDLTIEVRNVIIDESYAGSHSEVYPGRYVRVAVTDTGTGIPDSVVDKVFQPFFTTKEVGRGTGLGLSMVYGFVKQSKGHVEVYSEEGVGTSIKLYLPALVDGQIEKVQFDQLDTDDWTGQGEKILVTEDDHAVRESVCALFKSLNYNVLEAENAADAIVILKSDEPLDMLFSDIVMAGGMDGVSLANEAGIIRPSLKVLLTTGFAEVAIARGQLPKAVTEIIGKPYRRGDLARKVRGILDAKLKE